MGLLRRLFRRRKLDQPRNTTDTREADLERAWVGGWDSRSWDSRREAYVSTEEPSDSNDAVLPNKRNSEFHFEADILPRSPNHNRMVPLKESVATGTALQPTQGSRLNATSARPPLQKIPGALLSFPRFQEYVCTFLKDETVPLQQSSDQHLPIKRRESSVIEPLTPTETTIQKGCSAQTINLTSQTPSLVESVVPSLVYSEASPSPTSTRSSSAVTSLTSPSLTSSRTFFSSSSIGSYFSKRRANYHDRAMPPSATNPLRKQKRKKQRPTNARDAPLDGLQPVVPSVRHANTYVGSRSMSGPYPCITVRPRTSREGVQSTSALPVAGYYP